MYTYTYRKVSEAFLRLIGKKTKIIHSVQPLYKLVLMFVYAEPLPDRPGPHVVLTGTGEVSQHLNSTAATALVKWMDIYFYIIRIYRPFLRHIFLAIFGVNLHINLGDVEEIVGWRFILNTVLGPTLYTVTTLMLCYSYLG